MGSNRERERGIGYPRLTAEQIDLVLDNLIWAVRQRDLGHRLDLQEQTIGHLSSFYTRRWGLPPSIVGRVERIRELGAEWEATVNAAQAGKPGSVRPLVVTDNDGVVDS